LGSSSWVTGPHPLHTAMAYADRLGHLAGDAGTLGPVDIHRSHIMAPAKNNIDANESAVFS
jgi:hypothetical protein